jgi:hypothetical protein
MVCRERGQGEVLVVRLPGGHSVLARYSAATIDHKAAKAAVERQDSSSLTHHYTRQWVCCTRRPLPSSVGVCAGMLCCSPGGAGLSCPISRYYWSPASVGCMVMVLMVCEQQAATERTSKSKPVK